MRAHAELPRSTPESQGVSSASIQSFVDALECERLGVHSFVLVRHGTVVAEGWWKPYASYLQHIMFSVSKSFTSTAVGMAIAEGLVSLDDPVLSFFPAYDSPDIRKNMEGVLVRHLLSMSTGHSEDTMTRMRNNPNGDWVRIFLTTPILHQPGTHFLYNSGASYVLAAIVQSRTGQTLHDYLRPRLFDPLGIDQPRWQMNHAGVNLGASGLRLKTMDLAKVGQLYLQNGVWNGERLLSMEWIAEATRSQVENGSDPDDDWNQGYGYQIWRCRHNAYRFDGAFGQMCLIMPDHDLVLALTSGSRQLRPTLNAVWEHILPGLQEKRSEQIMPARRLNERLAALTLPVEQGDIFHPSAVQAFADRSIALEPNDLRARSISFSFSTDCTTMRIEDENGDVHRIFCGSTAWIYNTSPLWFYEEPPAPVILAARGGWRDEATFVVIWQYVEMPFQHRLVFHFDEDEAMVSIELDLPFWEERRQTLRGRLAN
ncbi:serine hydrolase domain-containing protein [Alicyclobacillus acidiphilus]|uniref:serine hydrolase domain-containing protein n=1 Tax=Alicyclobacillus acidiphilus TaxID=182455 RepID=UPI0008313749|nr:serine hydrolase [Alicyclobacillus acidiphilus]